MSGTPALAFDEFGRPFIIIRDQSYTIRLQGIAAHRVKLYKQLCMYLHNQLSLSLPLCLSIDLCVFSAVPHFSSTNSCQHLENIPWTKW